MSWTDNSNNEEGFQIIRWKPSESLPKVPQIQVGPNVTHYVDTGLTPETTYNYWVAAYNHDKGNNLYVAPSPGQPSVTTGPYPPENLQATAISSSEVKLTWKNRSVVADLLRIERKTGSGNFEKVLDKQWADINTYTDKGLKPNTSYTYRLVVWKMPLNASDYTKEVSLVTPTGLSRPPVSLPPVPLNIKK